jgi:hypothetical protein
MFLSGKAADEVSDRVDDERTSGPHRVTLCIFGISSGSRMAYETPLNVVPTSKARTRERVLPLYGFRVSLVTVIRGRDGEQREIEASEERRRGGDRNSWNPYLQRGKSFPFRAVYRPGNRPPTAMPATPSSASSDGLHARPSFSPLFFHIATFVCLQKASAIHTLALIPVRPIFLVPSLHPPTR